MSGSLTSRPAYALLEFESGGRTFRAFLRGGTVRGLDRTVQQIADDVAVTLSSGETWKVEIPDVFTLTTFDGRNPSYTTTLEDIGSITTWSVGDRRLYDFKLRTSAVAVHVK
jgi:hypothetical protein